jgi:hypothetical protein
MARSEGTRTGSCTRLVVVRVTGSRQHVEAPPGTAPSEYAPTPGSPPPPLPPLQPPPPPLPPLYPREVAWAAAPVDGRKRPPPVAAGSEETMSGVFSVAHEGPIETPPADGTPPEPHPSSPPRPLPSSPPPHATAAAAALAVSCAWRSRRARFSPTTRYVYIPQKREKRVMPMIETGRTRWSSAKAEMIIRRTWESRERSKW